MEVKDIYLHPKQYEAFCSTALYTGCIAGHQSGKSFVGAVWAGAKIQEFPQGVGCICAPTYPILRQSTLDKFFSLFPQYRQFYKEQKSVIELPTGGTVFIRSTDNPLSLEGMTLDWCWGDEFGMWTLLAWNIIRARLATKRGKFFGTTTPYNMGWSFENFYLPWKQKRDDDIAIYVWKSIESPYFPKDFAEKEKLRLHPKEYARRYEGEFNKMQGLVYDLPDVLILEPNEFNLARIQAREMTIAGIDWGFRNPTAIWVAALKDGVWYVIDEYYQSEKTTSEIIEKAKHLQRKWNINRWYADYAEPDRIEECRRADLYVQESLKDLKGGVSYIQQLINERRLYVFNYCRNFLDEINQYHYPEAVDGKAFKDEPEKVNDHLMDAMRYAIHTYQPQGNNWMTQLRVLENRNKNKSFL